MNKEKLRKKQAELKKRNEDRLTVVAVEKVQKTKKASSKAARVRKRNRKEEYRVRRRRRTTEKAAENKRVAKKIKEAKTLARALYAQVKRDRKFREKILGSHPIDHKTNFDIRFGPLGGENPAFKYSFSGSRNTKI